MPILRYLIVSLASALVAAYAALWYASPAPIEQSHVVTLPPLTVQVLPAKSSHSRQAAWSTSTLSKRTFFSISTMAAR